MGPARYSEPLYAYSDRSGRPEAARVRSLMNKWYMEYPESSRADLKGRFRSKDYGQHLGALNELFIHALFRHLGYEVDVASPGSSNRSRPDFALGSNTMPDFDLEATVAEFSSEERSRRKRTNVLQDTVNRMKSTDFILVVGAWSGPDTDPPSRKLRDELQQWLDGLDTDEVSSTNANGMDDFPTYCFRHGDWQAKFWAVPKKDEFRGIAEEHPIGGFLTGIHRLDSAGHIRRALKDKTTKYGLRERPYVIAVSFGSDNPFPRDRDLVAALLGSERWIVPRDVETVRIARERDGISWGPRGPQNTRVSGVILIQRLDAWNVATRKPYTWITLGLNIHCLSCHQSLIDGI